jgi:4-hydroxy-3-methylbut-2-en-1-yl diphosphate reductase
MSKRVLIAAPRSFCAGVVRAIDIVEKLLEQNGPPVYVRHEIVHNVHVVRDLEARGAVFVESEDDVPEGALVVLSAHGVAPQVYRRGATPAADSRSRSSVTPGMSRWKAPWARLPRR